MNELKTLAVIQRMSPCVDPDREQFIPAAKPGMLLVGGKELYQSILFKVEYVGARWVDFSDMPHRPDFMGKAALYIERRSSDMVILQRPVSAEATGELKVGKTYLLTSDRWTHTTAMHGALSYYAIKAKEVKSGEP